MTCEQAMRDYCSGDNNASLGEALLAHLASCPSCRGEVESMRAVLHSLVVDQPLLDSDLSGTILERIGEERMPISAWILPGLLILLGTAWLPFSREFAALSSRVGGSFEPTTSLVMGLMLTVYALLFIGLNLKVLSRKFGF
jgi:hypothetical protein